MRRMHPGTIGGHNAARSLPPCRDREFSEVSGQLRAGVADLRAPGAPDGAATVPEPILVIACGALAKELHAIRQANGWSHMRIKCIDARLHHRPALIPGRLREEIARARGKYRRIFVAYADCGTYGGIDRVLAAEPGIERLPGLHCYEFFAGAPQFRRLSDEEPGTFYLTDFLARFFDRFVMGALMLDRHPELMGSFFGNYRRVVYLSQTRDEELLAAARKAAETLGLEFHQVHCGYGALETSLTGFAGRLQAGSAPEGQARSGADDREICRSAA